MHIGKMLHSNYHVSDTAAPGIYMTYLMRKILVYGLLTIKMESSLHCQKAVSNANRILGNMIRRTFASMSKDLFVFLYTTYVRPHLEYCVQLWCPYLAKDIDLLEKVQIRATKFVKGIGRLPYTTRLRKLGLYSLYCQRQRGDLIEA